MTWNGILAFVLAAATAASLTSAANLAVGVASSISSYSVNNAVVSGTTNLVEGSELRTTKSPSEVVLQNGANVRLSSKSTGTVYRDRLVLRNGSVRISKFEEYPVEVRNLHIAADAMDSEAVIRTRGNTIEVASIGNGVKIMSGSSLLTRVGAGTRVSLKPNQSSANGYSNPHLSSDTHVLYWFIAAIAGAAIIIGSIAIAQGKGL